MEGYLMDGALKSWWKHRYKASRFRIEGTGTRLRENKEYCSLHHNFKNALGACVDFVMFSHPLFNKITILLSQG